MALIDSALAIPSSERLGWMRDLSPTQLETLQRQINDRTGADSSVALSAVTAKMRKVRVGRLYMRIPNAARWHRLRDSQVLTYFRGHLQMFSVRDGKIVERKLAAEDRRYLAKAFFNVRL